MSAELLTNDWPAPMELDLGPLRRRISDEEFFEFCGVNRDLRIERTAAGDLEIMPPLGGTSGAREIDLATQVQIWSKADGTGIAFNSSTGYRLPNRAVRAPDASWIRRERWEALSESEREKFLPLAPDFVIELRSITDRLSKLRKKMREYIRNGVRLGWLIDPYTKQVEIYRPGQKTATLRQPATLSGDPGLPGFVLDLKSTWPS